MTGKKYYSISEVAKMLGVPEHSLRYLEKSPKSKLVIKKIRGNRYYTLSNIEQLNHLLATTSTKRRAHNILLLAQIDNLIKEFNGLRATLKTALHDPVID